MQDNVTSAACASVPWPPLTEVRPLPEWAARNETAANRQGQCIHDLFEEQVQRTPDAIAVVFKDNYLTYRQLNQRAARLAGHLRTLGVGPDVVVGLHVERSLEMVSGLLGIWKAGGAYVPLDPAYPKDRLAFVLRDTHMNVLLTQAHLLANLPEYTGQVVCLERVAEKLAAEEAPPPGGTTPANLAYVIYTSGSTGRPKGVMIQHRSVVSLLHSLNQALATPGHHSRRVSLNGSISFDTSVKQLIQLLNGHTLYLVPEEMRFDATAFVASLQNHALDVLDCTPSQLRLFIAEGLLEKIEGRSLQVLIGGEAIDEVMWARLARSTAVNGYNVYGPTECTVDATVCQIRRSPDRPLLGQALANTQIHIVDAQLKPVDNGLPGELCISGGGVARGYWQRPDLTAEKFVPDPFSIQPGARLYRTGDLARLLPAGQIEFLGRLDQQVKVRGFRVELGEIEATIGQHPAVRQVAVLARETPGQPQDKRLIAYVVPQAGAFDVGALRQFLQHRLPDYMQPAAFVMLGALPLTPNGKVDRRALPAWEPDLTTSAEAYDAPRSPLQELIADQWAQVLGVARVGLHDNFFELGGHSLLAAQIVVRLRRQLGYDLAIQAVFEKPTVASLAALLESHLHAADTSRPASIERVARDQPVPLSFAQQQLWLIEQIAPGNIAYNIPLVLRLQGALNLQALHAGLNEMVQRHEILRTTFVLAGEEPMQAIAPELILPLPISDLRELHEAEREAQAEQAMRDHERRPFDLAHGPLLRAALYQLGDAEYRLSLVVHHIVFDGWSAGIFLTELLKLYQALAAGQPSPLPELTIQYADYAAQQRAWLRDAELVKQFAYWRQQLAGAPALLDLPLDHARPPVQSFRGAHQPIDLAQAVSAGVKALSRREHVTSFMLGLAVFEALLHRYTGQTDLVLGLPVANRNWPEIEDLIGYFVNVLVLRVDVAGDPSFRDVLKRVRNTLLSAFAHQDLPFAQLVEALRPERDLSYNPLFQVMCSSTPAVKIQSLPDLNTIFTEPESGSYESADLLLDLVETEQGLTGTLGYNVELFDEATITRMNADYVALLKRITADDADLERPLSDWLSFIPVPERRSRPRPQPADASATADTVTQRKLSLATRRANLSEAQRARLEKILRGV